jgi:hypothetical protein
MILEDPLVPGLHLLPAARATRLLGEPACDLLRSFLDVRHGPRRSLAPRTAI